MTSPIRSNEDRRLHDLSVSFIPADTLISFASSKAIQTVALPARSSHYGSLSVFATELLNIIIQHVDMQSLAALRLSNHALRTLVDENAQYRRLRKHAFNTIRALKETNVLRYHSMGDVYSSLTTKDCTFCGDYGPCLFIMTCERVCLTCITRRKDLRLIPRSFAPLYFGISTDQIRELKTLQPVPGHYRCHAYAGAITATRPGDVLVMASEVERRAISIYGSREQMEQSLEDVFAAQQSGKRNGNLRSFRSANPIYAHHPSRRPGHTVEDDQFYPSPLDWFHFTGVVELAVLEHKTSEFSKAHWCIACRYQFTARGHNVSANSWDHYRRWPQNFGRAFDRAKFLQHAESCEFAQELQKCRETGESYLGLY